MIDAAAALARLREGNLRFVRGPAPGAPGAPVSGPAEARAHRAELAGGQEPFAIVLGCSDSRVPAELVFDQGFGDLFVIRVAGNIVAPSQVGSVEFAAARFGTRLVLVLGHTQCGAITAALEELEGHATAQSRNLRSIVDRVRPAVQTALAAAHGSGVEGLARERLVHEAVRANVRVSADHLRHGSPLLEQLLRDEGLRVVGAEYSLETGMVDFFDGAEPGG